ncbi:hypothetical protein C0991_009470 [Blastosporella zonata]|nr:hypothetical protein C0991_009470 [Blastosporella zonata]
MEMDISEPQTLYASCADVLSVCKAMGDDIESVFNPDTGFAPRMRKVLQAQLQEMEETRDVGVTELDVELVRMEAKTWGLLQAVIPARITEPLPAPNPAALLKENPYTPTSTLAQAILTHSLLLTELVVVREWLQETAPVPAGPEATTGYWRFTKLGVVQALRTGGGLGAGGGREALVTKMDPDILGRQGQGGKGLAVDDANYEKSLVKALYGCVRAGRLGEAIEMCRKAHQPWRAASIMGSKFFKWRAISTEFEEEEDGAVEDDMDVWSGNKQRKLWKASCIRAALSSNLPEHERAFYAALAPSEQTAGVLRSACRTWEDHLWAQISIMCEERASGEMKKLDGSFWEDGLKALEGEGEDGEDTSMGDRGNDVREDERRWVERVGETLESLKDIAVAEGLGSEHAFHYSQLHIILNKTEMMLENFANALRNGSLPSSSREHAPLCRFFAHLCLYFQIVDIDIPPLATQVILESYLQVLEAAGQRDLIALYAGALGDNAVERYAMFLVSLELSVDTSERRLTLTRARDHGLDMDRVAISTAERTIEKAFGVRIVLPRLRGRLPSIIALQPPPTVQELILLRSIEWTTYNESTFSIALEQANVILRYFLGSGRLALAKQLLDILPPELARVGDPEEMATEYLHYRQFFVIWETLESVIETQAMEMACNRRKRELIRVRQIYIPELIIRLHSLLVASRHHIKENLTRALSLANTVADSRYKLYEDFVNEDGRRLGGYLGAVRQAILAGLEGGGSDPFRVLSV